MVNIIYFIFIRLLLIIIINCSPTRGQGAGLRLEAYRISMLEASMKRSAAPSVSGSTKKRATFSTPWANTEDRLSNDIRTNKILKVAFR